MVLKPKRLSFEQVAAAPMAAVTALQGLRDKGKVRAGHKVLINGASGSVGTFAVQIAKALGAEVTAVCSTQKVETAHSLGADYVIDYTREDVTQKIQQYDLILDVTAYRSFRDYQPILKPQGIYVMAGGDFRVFLRMRLQGSLLSKAGEQQFLVFVVKPNQQDLAFVKELLETNKIKSVIDRCYPLAEVPEVIRYLEAGRARGKIVIKI